jgi:heavy metal translocating P-type ATPase
MMQEAENNHAPMQRIADTWASRLVPAALGLALLVYFGTGDIIRAVTILVVFCPCALALATPTSIMAAIGQAAKYGVLIKSGEALENMGKVDSVAFDKTGTLTRGVLEVSDILSFAREWPSGELLRFAASAESRSEHPLGKAVAARARSENLELPPVERFCMLPGKGIRAEVAGMSVLCGHVAFLRENGVVVGEEAASALDALRNEGKAAILVAAPVQGSAQCIGALAFSDALRDSAKDMVGRLTRLDTSVTLLTGDNARTAAYFAQRAGIDDVRSELLPGQKVECIKKLQAEGRIVCMIGDGVNDAPALKTANVGVAMGSMGSDIAIDAADIALMGDDISKVPYVKQLANSTIRTIQGNIIVSLLINAVAVALSVLGVLTPITGSLVHNAGSVLVVLNAAALYDRKIE